MAKGKGSSNSNVYGSQPEAFADTVAGKALDSLAPKAAYVDLNRSGFDRSVQVYGDDSRQIPDAEFKRRIQAEIERARGSNELSTRQANKATRDAIRDSEAESAGRATSRVNGPNSSLSGGGNHPPSKPRPSLERE